MRHNVVCSRSPLPTGGKSGKKWTNFRTFRQFLALAKQSSPRQRRQAVGITAALLLVTSAASWYSVIITASSTSRSFVIFSSPSGGKSSRAVALAGCSAHSKAPERGRNHRARGANPEKGADCSSHSKAPKGRNRIARGANPEKGGANSKEGGANPEKGGANPEHWRNLLSPLLYNMRRYSKSGRRFPVCPAPRGLYVQTGTGLRVFTQI
jgi:hypothetical protein